jgi:hypothetical protein
MIQTMNKLPSYDVRFHWIDILNDWQIHGSLAEALDEHAISWLAENGLPEINELAHREVGTDIAFDKATSEFVVTVTTPWTP